MEELIFAHFASNSCVYQARDGGGFQKGIPPLRDEFFLNGRLINASSCHYLGYFALQASRYAHKSAHEIYFNPNLAPGARPCGSLGGGGMARIYTPVK